MRTRRSSAVWLVGARVSSQFDFLVASLAARAGQYVSRHVARKSLRASEFNQGWGC